MSLKLERSRARKRLRITKLPTWKNCHDHDNFDHYHDHYHDHHNHSHDIYQDSCHEVGNASFSRDKDAIPHTFDPFTAEHSEDDHETEKHSMIIFTIMTMT